MKRIVISYAREDRTIVEELAGTLRHWGHDVWTDAGAHSGGQWWDEILGRIRSGDLLLAVVSPASLVSRACTEERRYAMALHKVVLPVQVAPVDMQSLPPELATIHFFDFTVRDLPAAGRLYQALQQLPPPGPMPHPLPAPPPPPLSYLNRVAAEINALVPDLDVQHRIVTALVNGLRSPDPEERTTATELMQRFIGHPQSLQDPADRAREALTRAPGPSPGRYAGPPAPPPAQPVKRSRVTTVLAWVGGVTVALIGLGIWSAVSLGNGSGGGGGDGGSSVVPAATVSQRVYDDLVTQGLQPGTVTCGDLEVAVGATTYCSVTGLPNGGTTVRVTQTQGSSVTAWDYAS